MKLFFAKFFSNILQIRETNFTSKAPCLKNHGFLSADFKNLKAVGEP
jgi:hypothetical protein